jgi:hypothetical protein
VSGPRRRRARRWAHRIYGLALTPVIAMMLFAPMLMPAAQAGTGLAYQSDAGGSSSVDILSFLSQYGPLGVITALLIWFSRGAHQRERDRADRLEEENKRLNGIILERVIPAVIAATHVAEESAELLREFQWRRERTAMIDDERPPKGGRP